MNYDVGYVFKMIPKSWDGKSLILWTIVYFAWVLFFLVKAGFVLENFTEDQKEMLFAPVGLPVLLFVVFVRFRVDEISSKTDWWSFFNVNGAGLILAYRMVRPWLA